jgi:hypothetical protein
MKKALVLSLIALFAFGMVSFGQLSGYWSTSITIDPDAAEFGSFFTALGSTLKVDYALSGWTFGSLTGFDRAGFASQKFSAAGAMGAFSFSTSMSFDPAAITEKTYSRWSWMQWLMLLFSHPEYDELIGVCPIPWTATEVGPMFLNWDVTGTVSIAGVSFEVYVLQDYSAIDVLKVNYLWDVSGRKPVQTDSMAWTSDKQGMGWRLKVAGSFGAVNVTSYTYFNLTETDMADEVYSGLYVGKSGEIEVLTGCEFPFVEEYLLIEGFTFGCASIDIGVSILCTGFSDITFLVKNVSIGGWASFDFAITYGVDYKSISTAITLDALTYDCVELELGFGSGAYGEITDNVIDSIYVHGIKLVGTWNGVTFTSVTELDAASRLMSTATAYSYLNGSEQFGFMVPFVGKSLTGVPLYNDLNDDLWEIKCVATERYKLWEKFVIDVDADACCGGLFDLTIATYFGDHEVLQWAGYGEMAKGDREWYITSLYGSPGHAATFTDIAHGAAAAKRDTVSFKTVYKAGDITTLFNWAKTSVDLGVGVGVNVTLTLGFDISVYGWESLDAGFKWAF